MSCFSESVYAVYVDGELPAVELRAVQAHLIQCQHCRQQIVALQEEAGLLVDLLQDRAPASPLRPPVRVRARGLVVGLAPTLAAAIVAATFVGSLLDQRVPGFSWLNPLDLIGAYEMAFDTIFMLRDVAPALFDLGIAVGATAALAALLTFLVSALLRRVAGAVSLSLVAGLLAFTGGVLAPAPSAAVEVRWDQPSVAIPAGERLADSLFASAKTVDIDGDVDGDVVAFAESVTIRGSVRGNVFTAAREVLVIGRVDGSLHMACERCDLEGEVVRNLYAAGEDVTLARSGRVGRDATLAGENVRVDGRAERDLLAAAERFELRGAIGRDAHVRGERISVFDEASVGGDLEIETPDPAESQLASGAAIGGEVRQSVLEHPIHERGDRWLDGGFYLRAFVFLVSAFLVGLLLHAVLPGLFLGNLATSSDFMRCLGFGAAALVATPLVLVLCAITVVGIPIAILGAFAYLTLLFVSIIVVAALVGSSITGADPEGTHGFGAALLLGLVLVIAAMNLPFVGGVLRVLVGLAGMGLVIVTALDAWRRPRSAYA
jgi:cytoskeletal protein CcmA (bactofilin family)/predicted anti-sigma-YlaC factor YlaD